MESLSSKNKLTARSGAGRHPFLLGLGGLLFALEELGGSLDHRVDLDLGIVQEATRVAAVAAAVRAATSRAVRVVSVAVVVAGVAVAGATAESTSDSAQERTSLAA